MRTVIGGNGSNTTAAVKAMLLQGNEFHLPNLLLIGEPEDPMSLWLCDWPSPLTWPVYTDLKTVTPVAGYVFPHAFDPAVIKRGKVTSKFGLSVDPLDITWNPRAQNFGTSVATASPLQLAQAGFYDNMTVRVWTAYLPTPQSGSFVFPGDCNTFGCSELYGGYIADTQVDRNEIKFTVNSFLDVVNQNVPLNCVEMTNPVAAFSGATPPPGFSTVPTGTVAALSGGAGLNFATSVVFTPTYVGGRFDDNVLSGGFIVMNRGTANAGFFSSIYTNGHVTISGTTYNYVVLYQPFPFTPQIGDTFYISGKPTTTANASLWDGGDTYSVGDAVLYLGTVYVSTQNSNTGNTPVATSSFWQLQPFYGFLSVPAPQSIGGG